MEQTKQQEIENIKTEESINNATDVTKANHEATSGGIGYSGTIKVTIKQGKHTISTKTYHNHGTSLLFNFMAQVLAGKYSSVSSHRPQRLMLFEVDVATGAATPCLTGPVVYNTTPDVIPLIDDGDGSVTGYATVLHFSIPGTLFNPNTYNRAALYDSNGMPARDGEDPQYAVFDFKDDRQQFADQTILEGQTAIIE